jgi:hypothetical protein
MIFALALAGSMPDYDVPNMCKGVGALGVANPATAYQTCIRDESVAQQNLMRAPANIPATIRAKCIEEAQILPRVSSRVSPVSRWSLKSISGHTNCPSRRSMSRRCRSLAIRSADGQWRAKV